MRLDHLLSKETMIIVDAIIVSLISRSSAKSCNKQAVEEKKASLL